MCTVDSKAYLRECNMVGVGGACAAVTNCPLVDSGKLKGLSTIMSLP